MVDFKADLRESTVATLESYHVRYKESDNLHTLLKRLYTFWEKYISPKKRNVLISEELSESLATYPQSVQSAFAKMVEWTEAGIDINCFQSRSLYGKGSRDYQNMLYRIVHLHLSAKKEDINPVIKKDGFAKPGQYLLFAHFDETHAYFLKILKHPQTSGEDGNIALEWVSKDILGIMTHNWPELLADKKIENASLCDEEGTPIDIDDNAIAALTSNHINTFFTMDGSLYRTGFGMTCSGDSTIAVLCANRLIQDAERAQQYYECNEINLCKRFEDLLNKHDIPIPDAHDIHYEYVHCLEQFLIVDRNFHTAYAWTSNKMYLLSEDKDS